MDKNESKKVGDERLPSSTRSSLWLQNISYHSHPNPHLLRGSRTLLDLKPLRRSLILLITTPEMVMMCPDEHCCACEWDHMTGRRWVPHEHSCACCGSHCKSVITFTSPDSVSAFRLISRN
ncbi:unnamed protein product [Musa textilis]